MNKKLKDLDPKSLEYKKLKTRNDKGNKAKAKKRKANNLEKLKLDLAKPIRKCTKCKKDKAKESFSKYKSERYNRLIYKCRCKDCLKIDRNKKYKTDKGIFTRYKVDSKRRNRDYEFKLEFEHFSKLINSNCEYCGAENSRGVDRKDNNKGYTIANSVSCCVVCNRMKNKHTFKEFVNHCKLIASRN